MEGKRVLIIVVLILLGLAALFAVGIAWGVRNDRNKENETSADEFSSQPNSQRWTESFGEWLRPYSPKLKLGRSKFVVAAGSSISDILVPSSDKPFRSGTFFLSSGLRAVIVYHAEVQTSGEQLKNPQELELPRKKRDENDDPRHGTLAILRAGGTLEIRCAPGTLPCTVEIE